MIEADGKGAPFVVAATLHATANDVVDPVQPIETAKAGGVGTDGGSATVIVALEEEVRLDDTVATYTPALPYAWEIENAVD